MARRKTTGAVGRAAGTRPIISGGRSNTSDILLDGATTRNTTTNDNTYRLPLEAVAEFKVITNNVNFSGPNVSVGHVDFGRITSAGGGREIQIGIRLSY